MKVNYSKSLHNKSRCLNTMKSFLTFKIINTGVFLYFQKVLSLKLGRKPSSIRTAILFCFICTAWRGEYLTIIPRARMDYWCVSLLLNVFYRSLNVNLRLPIGKLVRKMNSNRFISCSWIRNLSVWLESAHWRLCHPLLLLTCFFLTYVISWIAKRFFRNFVLILTFSFLGYFTEVLCAAFYKILIKYFDVLIIIIISIIIAIILDSLQVLQWLQGFWKRRLFYRDTLFQLKWVLVLGPYTFKSVITLICSWLMLFSTIEAGVCFRVAHAFLAPPTH